MATLAMRSSMDAANAPGAGATQGPEHRRDRRMRVLKGGRILFNGGYSAFDCRVKNLSESGALLEMPSLLGIPTKFEFVLDGVKKQCTVMWRTDRLMGVAFDPSNLAGKAA
jgi:hypothetical protein